MSTQNATLNGHVCKTPVTIEAQQLTDNMGEPINFDRHMKLIIQIISNQIAVTFVTETDYAYRNNYTQLLIDQRKNEITIKDSDFQRRFEISSYSREWLKTWFLSVTDRPWPFSAAYERGEKILFDFSQQDMPTLPKTSNTAYLVDI
jgi:hypothetical protein